jgi:hypothetical protein
MDRMTDFDLLAIRERSCSILENIGWLSDGRCLVDLTLLTSSISLP